MRNDLTRDWQHLKRDLAHWRGRADDAAAWIDDGHDYTRGRVAVPHRPRRFDEARAARPSPRRERIVEH